MSFVSHCYQKYMLALGSCPPGACHAALWAPSVSCPGSFVFTSSPDASSWCLPSTGTNTSSKNRNRRGTTWVCAAARAIDSIFRPMMSDRSVIMTSITGLTSWRRFFHTDRMNFWQKCHAMCNRRSKRPPYACSTVTKPGRSVCGSSCVRNWYDQRDFDQYANVTELFLRAIKMLLLQLFQRLKSLFFVGITEIIKNHIPPRPRRDGFSLLTSPPASSVSSAITSVSDPFVVLL